MPRVPSALVISSASFPSFSSEGASERASEGVPRLRIQGNCPSFGQQRKKGTARYVKLDPRRKRPNNVKEEKGTLTRKDNTFEPPLVRRCSLSSLNAPAREWLFPSQKCSHHHVLFWRTFLRTIGRKHFFVCFSSLLPGFFYSSSSQKEA